MKKIINPFLCAVLVLAVCFVFAACGDDEPISSQPSNSSETSSVDLGIGAENIGSGKAVFYLMVTDAEGYGSAYAVHTDEKTVGAALRSIDFIETEEGESGLYLKTVGGIVVDPTDGAHWAFYIDDKYAPAGVDETEITEGAFYALKIEP